MKKLALALLLFLTPAWAITVDEVIELSKAKVSDAVIIGKIRSDASTFTLSVQDILRLKREGISDAVLQVMVESGGAAQPPRPIAPPRPLGGGGVSGAPTDLTVTNADSARGYSLQVDPRGGNLFVYFEHMRDREVFRAGESRAVSVPAGSYRLRWVGEPRIYNVPVAAGRKTELKFSSRQDGDAEDVSVEIVVDGQRIDGGSLKKITPAITPNRNPWGGFPSPEEQAWINAGQPSAAVVPQTTTYYYPAGYTYYRPVEQPVVVYRVGYYGGGGCGDGRYEYRGGYYGGYRSHSLFGPSTLFWTGVGGAIGAANDNVGAGLGAGFLFGHLLDDSFGY